MLAKYVVHRDTNYISTATSLAGHCIVCGANRLIRWTKVAATLQVINGATVCIFTIVQFARESCQMYRVTRQQELDQYVSLLVERGILYFRLCVFD